MEPNRLDLVTEDQWKVHILLYKNMDTFLLILVCLTRLVQQIVMKAFAKEKKMNIIANHKIFAVLVILIRQMEVFVKA